MNERERRATNKMFCFSWKRLLCFPVSHWLIFNDSVLDSACDWLALSPLHHSDTCLVSENERMNEKEVKQGISSVCTRYRVVHSN